MLFGSRFGAGGGSGGSSLLGSLLGTYTGSGGSSSAGSSVGTSSVMQLLSAFAGSGRSLPDHMDWVDTDLIYL